MKKYTIKVKAYYKGGSSEINIPIIAQGEKSAMNKAVRRARYMLDDKTITLANVESVKYEGFYLNRQFIPVYPRELYNRFLSLP